ncbi:MAG TPA: Calx-beta domain-containing protein, partial [Syntrophomonas sp.]|nr:Calx-beta domain-containing protein [Syntrophomonas sp.]
PENDESKLLIESTVEIEDESSPATDGEETALNDETAAENINDEAITSGNSEKYETIAGPDLKEDSAGNGLRGARDTALGKESTRQNWRQITETEKKSAIDSHKKMYAEVPGVTCTINFADGEYIKKIRFNTIDDQISEDEEQVMMALVNPQGGTTGDSLNAFMNIVDNEEKETVLFAMQDSEVESDPSTGYSVVTVKRIAGLYRYGLINVGTAALSAEPEVDYKPVMTELRFIPGQETQTVKIPIISGISGEGLQFCVKLDPESPNLSVGETTQTIVTIKPSTKYLMQASDDIPTMASSDTSSFSSLSTITPQATEGMEFDSGKNYRVKTLTTYDIAGYKNYAIAAGPCAFIPISSQNDSNWIYYNADLTMVEKIKFDWFNPCTGEYKGWGWINPVYYQNFYTYMQIRGDTKVVHIGKFPSQWEEYILSDLDRQPTNIKFMTQTFGDARRSELYVGNVKLYYIPVKIRLKTLLDDPDANIIPKTWSASGTSTDGKKVYAGQLAFANDTSVDEKTFYDGDTVYLAPKFASSDLDTSKVYLWGYKIEKVGGGYYYIQGDKLNIRNAYAGALRDINGSYIPRSQILMNNNQIVLLPVYKARNAFIKINFDREKGGMINNGFTSGETMKIGMLDTVKFNAFANDGYYVSGYDHLNINYEGDAITSNAMERSMESWSPQSAENAMQTYFSGEYLTMAEPVADIAINPAVPNELDFKPQKNFTNLTVQYSVPFLTAKVDPKSGSKTKGAVAYFPENGEPQVGNSTTPLVISPIKRNQA